MKRTFGFIAVSTAVVLVGLMACSSGRGTVSDLDAAVRGNESTEIWSRLPANFKHLACLRYKISSMRRLVSVVSKPVELLDYYPLWEESLAECGAQYPIDDKKAEQLREAVATKMATVIGKEVTSYLTLQRLYSSEPREKWLDMWRSWAITGIAGVSEVLPEKL